MSFGVEYVKPSSDHTILVALPCSPTFPLASFLINDEAEVVGLAVFYLRDMLFSPNSGEMKRILSSLNEFSGALRTLNFQVNYLDQETESYQHPPPHHTHQIKKPSALLWFSFELSGLLSWSGRTFHKRIAEQCARNVGAKA